MEEVEDYHEDLDELYGHEVDDEHDGQDDLDDNDDLHDDHDEMPVPPSSKAPRFDYYPPQAEVLQEPKYQYRIENIVSTVDVGCPLDLRKITVRIRNAEYNPKRFRAVICRLYEPRTTAMIFASGKIVVTGAKSEDSSLYAAKKFKMMLKKIGNDVQPIRFRVENIVATVDLKFPIDLEKLATAHCQFSSYDPDFFPACIYRMVRPRTVLLIFVSGKIIVTGARSREDIDATMSNLTPVFESFRKQTFSAQLLPNSR